MRSLTRGFVPSTLPFRNNALQSVQSMYGMALMVHCLRTPQHCHCLARYLNGILVFKCYPVLPVAPAFTQCTSLFPTARLKTKQTVIILYRGSARGITARIPRRRSIYPISVPLTDLAYYELREMFNNRT